MKLLSLMIGLVLCIQEARAQQGYNVGQVVEVYDPIEKNWFNSTILKIENARYFIHYKGYDAKWDVWVDDTRIRGVGEVKESPIFYLIGSNDDQFTNYRGDQLAMAYFTNDSIGYRVGNASYSFLRQPGKDFLTGRQKVDGNYLYVEPVDANSFMLSRSNLRITYYHRNKEVGTRMMNNKELGQYVDSALVHVGKTETARIAEGERSEKIAQEAQAKQKEETQFKAISHFVKTYASKMNDAVLRAEITKWWNGTGKVVNPLLKIYIANADYTVSRNEFGVILNKHVTALLIYKMGGDGKCYVKWQNFGYENTGGSTYSTALLTWAPSDTVFNMEGEQLDAGTPYLLDCKSVQN